MRPDQDLVKWQGDEHSCGQSVSCRCCWYDDTWHHHITIPGCQIVVCSIFSYYVNYWFCCLCYNTTVVHGKENIDSVLSGRIGPALSVVNHNSCFDDHNIMIMISWYLGSSVITTSADQHQAHQLPEHGTEWWPNLLLLSLIVPYILFTWHPWANSQYSHKIFKIN